MPASQGVRPAGSIEISCREAAQLLKGPNPPKLIDVRTDEERKIACLAGSIQLTEDLVATISEKWPKDATILFHCHHGIRSLGAATHFAQIGFVNVKSITGGIDRWSIEVDPAVPRY